MSLSVVCRQSYILKDDYYFSCCCGSSVVYRFFFKISTSRLTYLHIGDSQLLREESRHLIDGEKEEKTVNRTTLDQIAIQICFFNGKYSMND
jgi:hypothetical protein